MYDCPFEPCYSQNVSLIINTLLFALFFKDFTFVHLSYTFIQLYLQSVRVFMTYYKDNTLFKRKDGRLHIYKRKDKKSENWYARTFIDKKQIQISSKTSNKKQAINIFYKKLM